MQIQIPTKFRALFWEYDLSSLDVSKYKKFIIERILEKGNWDAVSWIFKIFDPEEIKLAIQNSRNLSSGTAYMWNYILKS